MFCASQIVHGTCSQNNIRQQATEELKLQKNASERRQRALPRNYACPKLNSRYPTLAHPSYPVLPAIASRPHCECRSPSSSMLLGRGGRQLRSRKRTYLRASRTMWDSCTAPVRQLPQGSAGAAGTEAGQTPSPVASSRTMVRCNSTLALLGLRMLARLLNLVLSSSEFSSPSAYSEDTVQRGLW